jgi:cyclopropane fatty-acyl-phospholipid synthase-like methyltransferase
MDFDAYERGLWAGRTAAYERGFARLTAHAAGALLDAAGVTAGTGVLDVGTGPGVVAGAAAAPTRHLRVTRRTGTRICCGSIGASASC